MHKVWSPSDATLEFFVCKMERMIFNCEKYNVEHITTIDQVKQFTKYLVEDLKVNINPDNDFADYVEYETGAGKSTRLPPARRLPQAARHATE